MSINKWLETVGPGNEEKVSIEGFMETAGDILRNLIKGKKEELNINNLASLKETLNRTYLNESWLSDRRIITGDVKVEASTGILGKGSPESEIAKLLSDADSKNAKNKSILKSQLAKAMPAIKYMTSGGWKDPSKADAVEEKLPLDPELKYESVKLGDLGTGATTVKALTVDEVVKYSKYLLELLEKKNDYYIFKGEWDNAFYERGKNGLVPLFEDESSLWNEIENHYKDNVPRDVDHLFKRLGDYYYWVEEEYYQNVIDGSLIIARAAKAIVNHIDASVK